MTTSKSVDYSIISERYDSTRTPVGMPLIKNLIKKSDIILDAGCGTGNYTGILSSLVNKVIGLEINKDMLEQARKKLANLNNVELIQGSLLEDLPFQEKQFDGIMINQVFHHLDTDTESFPNVKNLISKLLPLLKPDGFLAINTCSREQVDAFWWVHLIPNVREKYRQRYIPLPLLKQYLEEAGYVELQISGIKEPLQGLAYFNLMGPFLDNWRAGDSKWNAATDEEIIEAKKILIEKLKNSELGQFFDEKEKLRQEKGLTSYVIARRKEN